MAFDRSLEWSHPIGFDERLKNPSELIVLCGRKLLFNHRRGIEATKAAMNFEFRGGST